MEIGCDVKDSKHLRGIQINAGSYTTYFFGNTLRDITVDCHLGSLIITKEELIDLLEKRRKKP